MSNGPERSSAMAGGVLAMAEAERSRMEANRRVAALEAEQRTLVELRELLSMEEQHWTRRLAFAREQADRLEQSIVAATERSVALEQERATLVRRVDELERDCAEGEALQQELADKDASIRAAVAALREELSMATRALETEREALERMDKAVAARSARGAKRSA